MGTAEILTLIGMTLLWGSALITFFVKIKIQMAELELKIDNNQHEFENHAIRKKEQINRLDKRIDLMKEDNKQERKDIMLKIDNLIENINNMKIDIITKISEK